MIKYKKTEWKNDTKLTAKLLNNIENGIEMCVNEINSIVNNRSPFSSSVDVTQVSAICNELIEYHDMMGNAHSELFRTKAGINHTHNSADIVDLDIDNNDETVVMATQPSVEVESLKEDINKLQKQLKSQQKEIKLLKEQIAEGN